MILMKDHQLSKTSSDQEDLMKVFLEFHNSEVINKSTDATSIAVVPKKKFRYL